MADTPPQAVRLNILLVEDHPDLAELTGMMIEALGHAVVIVGSLAEAVTAWGQRPFDLLLADYRLPDGNARELVMRLRQHGPVRAILLTATHPDDMSPIAREGFACCLEKPAEPERLGPAIAAAMASPLSAGE